MIKHLKEVHRELYLPLAHDPTPPPYKVTPITAPFLYTDANINVESFDNPNQSVKVEISNVGGGKLHVERIRIPRGFEKWIKRAEGSKPATLISTSEPLELELKLSLRTLPNPSTENVVELSVISSSKRKTFSQILLRVQPPDTQSTNLTLPEYINFGEITTYKVSIADKREDAETPSTDFLLIGDFTLYPPIRLEITQKNESTFDTYIYTSNNELYYTLDLQNPGVVMPREKKAGIALKSFQQTFPIPNISPALFSKHTITSDTDWLIVPSKIHITDYGTTELPISVNVEKLKPGRNVAELHLAGEKISVWAWYKIANEKTLTLGKEQTDLHHVETFDEQEKPLPIDVVPEDDLYQSVMIFGDVDFQFPLTGEERVGYLMGDFNDWVPRTLFLEKRDDNYGITLSLSEGTYLYRAEIDGEMRLDPTRLYEIVCCKHGFASKLEVERIEQQLTLHNRTKQKLELNLKSTTEWLRIKPETLVLPALKKSNITAVIRSEKLTPGLNLGWLLLETAKEPIRSLQVPIYVIGVTNGVVPRLKQDVLTFPEMEQSNSARIPLDLEIVGQGELKGEIQPSTVLRFAEGNLDVQNGNIYEPKTAQALVEVITERPSNAYRKSIGASLITDCYLANRRVHRFEAKYEMTHLQTDPPALYFPKVYLFDIPKQAGVMVKRSDGKAKVMCDVEIPDDLTQSGLLSAKSDGDQCDFILNPQAAKNAGRISDVIMFTDKNSGMSLPIQFAADMIGSNSEIDVTEGRKGTNNILLTIKNIGKVDLRIFEVSFKYQRFYLTPPLSSYQCAILPSESFERNITLRPSISLLSKKTVGFFRKATVRDTLIIRLSDPQYPKGVFEKEIVAEIK